MQRRLLSYEGFQVYLHKTHKTKLCMGFHLQNNTNPRVGTGHWKGITCAQMCVKEQVRGRSRNL